MSSQELENWADELLAEYKDGRRDLGRMKNNLEPELVQDKSKINSMIDDMSFSIDWMKTGRQPGLYRGVDKRDAYRVKRYNEIEIIPDITEQLEREPLYMDQEQRTALLQLFRSFSDRERQCYIMHEAEQLSFSQIALRLGVTKAAVQSYINRARKKVEEIAS
ncbi:RNA polymerase subunit sigma-70 [Oceanobacillus profundus]|uniref:sigma factor-like helix-turn-helix DNA-binding protein n=1 Tax=Oceanobacillus profundus TaxID=372463 RepID=UPI00203E8B3B|nr:sigma factor-like helix-turn-helix DNA-binding protein [Oceanobacillus profundus]MCM3396468.1 RNA polymerase subunit sigma-70 [Oceanobacillus profundus]